MEIKGKVKISNKWVNGEYSKTEFDFENKGNFAIGSLQWSDVKKGKNGAKDEFTTTKKRFVTFDGDVVGFINRSFGHYIIIEGTLVGSSYIDKEGKKKVQEQIVVSKAYSPSLEEKTKSIDKHNQSKGNGYQSQQDIFADDSIPF